MCNFCKSSQIIEMTGNGFKFVLTKEAVNDETVPISVADGVLTMVLPDEVAEKLSQEEPKTFDLGEVALEILKGMGIQNAAVITI
ncbi:TPA: hypothetical protein NKV88_002868 [Vibrio parahaemolyticus]|nr:hypothetical protein [Vibrio parahaemolyticus]MDG3050145.1 hypothetical protein [Vibrio parahaemolyticus]HCH4149559.1 hypothetical protein [Vibrio parahaemolyticus]